MKGRALFLYNDKAGRGNFSRKAAAISDVLREGGYEVVPQAIEFGRNPFDGNETVDIVVAAGGDGTMNYVINNMKAKGLDIPLGVIPAGTANDFARALGMRRGALAAARQIASGEVKSVDCGRVNGLYYVNVFSFGLFTTTSQHTPDGIKHRIGRLAYLFEGIKEIKEMRTIPLEVTTDERTFKVEALIALVFNGETAGSLPLAPGASISDGLLDCIFICRSDVLLLGINVIRHMIGGYPSSIVYLRSRHIRITSTLGDIATDVDGQRGVDFPLDVECLPGGLKVVAPAKE